MLVSYKIVSWVANKLRKYFWLLSIFWLMVEGWVTRFLLKQVFQTESWLKVNDIRFDEQRNHMNVYLINNPILILNTYLET